MSPVVGARSVTFLMRLRNRERALFTATDSLCSANVY